MSNLKIERELAGGSVGKGEYFADGKGTLHAWGESYARTWRVESDQVVCVIQEGVYVSTTIDQQQQQN